ncbi:MAG: hypothetical protein K2K89_04285 [Ruminococcus sp.]|nr:hypothetical protein [Ruminococcus sp.]
MGDTIFAHIEDHIHDMNRWANQLLFSIVILFIISIVFWVSVLKMSNAYSNYLIIKKFTFADKKWKLVTAKVDRFSDYDTSITYITEERIYNSNLSDTKCEFFQGKSVNILYRTNNPKKYIPYDKEYFKNKLISNLICSIISCALSMLIVFKIIF